MEKKKVSLLLMTYNNVVNLKKTLESIERQDYPNIEIVISDSLSTDGTVELIKEMSAKSKYEFNWISEKDDGLYYALNKDIKRATGEYLLVANDEFIDKNAITKLVDAIERENSDGAHADLIYANDQIVKRYWRMNKGTIRTGWLPGHPTLMLKKEVYEEYGDYNCQYKSASDYEFMIRILKNGKIKLSYVPEILVRMYYGGTSTGGVKNYWRSIQEGHEALINNNMRWAGVIDILRTIRVLKQFIFKKDANEKWKVIKKTRG